VSTSIKVQSRDHQKSFLNCGISNALDGSEDDCVNSDIPPLDASEDGEEGDQEDDDDDMAIHFQMMRTVKRTLNTNIEVTILAVLFCCSTVCYYITNLDF